MHCALHILSIFSFIYLTHAVILKTTMANNYPQVAVLGCSSKKANIYYDVQRRTWVENLVSSCIDDEESILNFCKQSYPSLNIGNIMRLDTVLNFEDWCELLPLKTDEISRCKSSSLTDESIQPFRCLHRNSQRENEFFQTKDCNLNSITQSNQCYRTEKWQELATLNCANKNTVLNSTLSPLQWCGLSQFYGVKFLCCALKDNDEKADYDTNIAEDEPINELLVVPPTTTVENHRRVIAMSIGSREPNWIKDSQQWSTNNAYFADDEDVNDEKEDIKLSSTKKSHLTINEHDRFTKDKQEFKRKYSEQIDQLKSRWQLRQNELQKLALENPNRAQDEYEKSEVQFRQDYEFLKQSATRERARINQLHENNLDSILDIAKIDAKTKLNAIWKENPLKHTYLTKEVETLIHKNENLKDALYNYLHVLLRDRIHLVNRYSRLQVVDPEQAKIKRIPIHERLRSIANEINQALTKLRQYPKYQLIIRPYLDNLLLEYDEVNQAAEKLLIDYNASLTTTIKSRIVPLGRDEKKIYPFSVTTINKIDDNNNEYDYGKIEEDNDDDDYDDDDDDDENTSSTTSMTTTTTENNNWDLNQEFIDVIPMDTIRDDLFINSKRPINKSRRLLMAYLPYIIGILFLLCVIFGLLIFRILMQQRRRSQYGNHYEKNYVFTEIDTTTPEDRALHALQANGYENPTYKFFESQTQKC